MKLIRFFALALSMMPLCGISHAEPKGKLPKLQGAIRGGKPMAIKNEEGFEGCRYLFDSEIKFESIKKDTEKFLGSKWIELKRGKKEYLALKQVMKSEGILLEGVATYLNPDFPDWQIDLLMKKETVEGKARYIVEMVGSPKNR